MQKYEVLGDMTHLTSPVLALLRATVRHWFPEPTDYQQQQSFVGAHVRQQQQEQQQSQQ